jgi:predicted Zn finger-like uncharacterized protein
MLIVCPNCATSYAIDQAAVGPAGRTVRCARCKSTWFAGGSENAPGRAPKTAPDLSAFVDGVIAEAEARAGGPARTHSQPKSPPRERAAGDDDFGGDEEEAEIAPARADHPPAMPRAEPFASATAAAPAGEADWPQPIADAPSLVPPIGHEALPEIQPAAEPEDVESFAARREKAQSRRQRSRRSSRWVALLLVLLAFNVAVVGARNEVVRYLPQTASLFAAIGLPVNLRNLRFENVRISKVTEDGAPILIVQGTIVSDGDKPLPVPRLRFAARNKSGQEVYTWTMRPDRSILPPGETLDFRSRLGAPPKDAQDVMVRFFTAKDAEAQAK